MIVCHEKKLIFLKTKKTAGTSLEIALAGHCGPRCIITKISETDESLRQALGYPGPQNYSFKQRRKIIWRERVEFRKHMSVNDARALLPKKVWDNYCKFTIVRDPFDRAISRYYWDLSRGKVEDIAFDEFYEKFPERLHENIKIAPLNDTTQLNFHLRYEYLEDDMHKNNLGFLWKTFQGVRAKTGHRPRSGSGTVEMYKKYPTVAKLIEESCQEEIKRFGYQAPLV